MAERASETTAAPAPERPMPRKIQEIHPGRWTYVPVADHLKRRFWDKRPNGMVIDKEDKVCYEIEFKRAFERYGGAQEKTRQKAERQHGNLIQGWTGALNDRTWRVMEHAPSLLGRAQFVEHD